jgi:phage shock protein A
MADVSPMTPPNFKEKSFWKRPEGVTGVIFLLAILAGVGFLLFTILPPLTVIVANTLYLAGMILVLGAILYMVLDPKMRNLIAYMYKGAMRKITSVFVTIDPIGILKNYVDDLEDNLQKMSKQIGAIRGQMRKLQTIIEENKKEIENNLLIAKKAKEKDNDKQMLLSSRKAARLKDSNIKYNELLNKMQILYRVLTKMYQNSEILLEDTKDQVKMKEQERKAIRASHSAMKSAMNVISGNSDQRMMFDQALEAIADDVANKVGEMERFMELSSSFMDSVDLQNGVFEEQGLKMLEEWEKQSTLLLMGGESSTSDFLDLNESFKEPEKVKKSGKDSSYDSLFN